MYQNQTVSIITSSYNILKRFKIGLGGLISCNTYV